MGGMAYNPDTKARENRVRNTARRRGLTLTKSPRKDELAPDYNKWALTGCAGKPIVTGRTGHTLTLEEVEEALRIKPTTRRPKKSTKNGAQP